MATCMGTGAMATCARPRRTAIMGKLPTPPLCAWGLTRDELTGIGLRCPQVPDELGQVKNVQGQQKGRALVSSWLWLWLWFSSCCTSPAVRLRPGAKPPPPRSPAAFGTAGSEPLHTGLRFMSNMTPKILRTSHLRLPASH